MTSTADSALTSPYNPRHEPHRSSPWDWYRQARDHEPVTWSPDVGAWIVTRYDDIAAVNDDPATFSSSVAAPPLDQMVPPEVLQVLATAGPPGRHMLQADPPEHESLRGIGQRVVSGPRINSARPLMAEIAGHLIDEFAEDGRVELVNGFSYKYVHQVLSSMVGIPVEDRDQVDAWNNSFLTLMDPTATVEQKLEAARLFVEYEQYLTEMISDRKQRPRDDMTSEAVRLYSADGVGLDDALPDIKMFVRGLYAGGIHTTKNAITSTVLTLLTRPGDWRAAHDDPSGIPAILEEILRLEAPHRGLLRLVTTDTSLGGVSLPAGSMVFLLYGSANRDERRFADPDEFRPARENARAHMAFGYGIHTCLGAHLARTEARIALETLTRKLPHARLADDYAPSYAPEFYFRELESLRITW